MKTVPNGLGTSTLAVCWRVQRQDGQLVLGTEHDRNITIESGSLAGIYLSRVGITGSDLKSASDLSVDNLEVEAHRTDDMTIMGLRALDIEGGLYDNASCVLFQVNWEDTTKTLVQRRGTLGIAVRTHEGRYRTELRGMSQQLTQSLVRTFSVTCDAELGDDRCKVDVTPFILSGVVVAVDSRRHFYADFTFDSAPPDSDFYRGGSLRWNSGGNESFSMEVNREVRGVLDSPGGSPVDSPGDSPPPATGSGIQFTPNHWIQFLPGNDDNLLITSTVTDCPELVGVLTTFYWNELESSMGVYDFSEVISKLNHVGGDGRKYVVKIHDKTFDTDSSGGANPLPGYLSSHALPNQTGGYTTIRWNATVVTRFKALITALLDAIDGLGTYAQFEGIALQETALGLTSSQLSSNGYSATVYGDYYIDMIQWFATAAPTKRVWWLANFIQGGQSQISRVVTTCKPLGNFMLIGPDNWPTSTALSTNVYPYWDLHQGDCPLGICNSVPSYSEGMTMQEIHEFAVEELHVDIEVWTWKPSGTYNFPDDAVPVIQGDPAFAGSTGYTNWEESAYYTQESEVHLFLPMPADIEVGDTFTLRPGCDKKRSTCVSAYNNLPNFRGHGFYVPGQMEVLKVGGQGA